MQMLYNSDDFAVVQIEFEPGEAAGAVAADAAASPGGGFEIVDKRLRKEIFLEGPLAARFREQVDALVKTGPSTEAIDDFLAGYSGWMHQNLLAY
jgi:Protein of unknown function (DUF3567)